MSHAARAKVPKMKDINILEKAIARVHGWTAKRNATVRSYYNDGKKFDLVLVNPGKDNFDYDLGVIRNADGTLSFEGDLSMLENNEHFKLLGKNYQALVQAYSIEEEIVKGGNDVLGILETKLENGTMVLEIEYAERIV
jgi:hypothetical protein